MGFCKIKHLVVLVAIVVLGSIDCHSQLLERIQKALPQQEVVDSGKGGSSVVDSLRHELELARQRGTLSVYARAVVVHGSACVHHFSANRETCLYAVGLSVDTGEKHPDGNCFLYSQSVYHHCHLSGYQISGALLSLIYI